MACKHDDGTWHEYPQQPSLGYDRYSPRKTCPDCGFNSPRYCRNGACVVCSRDQSIGFYNTAHGASNPLNVMVGRAPIVMDASQWDVIVPLYQAAPGNYKVKIEPCDKAGHIGMRFAATGRCVLCTIAATDTPSPAETSPRQEAIANGEKWYTPVKPCKQCGETALRSVANGECKGCRSGSGPTVSARKAAAAAGESWYESEELCGCGRRQWKYVANGRVRRCACGV